MGKNLLFETTNETRGVILGRQIRKAESFASRSIGLLTRSSLSEGEGLWIAPCDAVHTFFMRFTIDILFLDKAGLVLEKRTLRPWRMSPWVRGSAGVLELPEGVIAQSGTQVGDTLSMREANRRPERNN